MQTERIFHKKVSTYLKDFYPKVYFISDPLGIHTTWGLKQIILQTNSEHKHLDIFIAKKSLCGNYRGLFMELKIESPYKNDGSLKKNEHLEKQFETILMLRKENYKADFYWSMDQAIFILNEYLGAPEIDETPLF